MADDRRTIWTTLMFVALAVAGLMVAGAVWERMERRQERGRLKQIGRSVDIGGRSINLYCSGEGSPSVIFESAPPMTGYSWVFVQREVAKFTRACWYDRAGYGWSDPGPNPRDGTTIATDLNQTLRAAGEGPPYVLVGATFGALYARRYQKLYPKEVAGVVFVDPVCAGGECDPKGKGATPQFLHYPQSLLAQGFNQVGLVRLLRLGERRRPHDEIPEGLTREEWTRIWDLRNLPKTRVALLQELAIDFGAEADDKSDKLSTKRNRTVGGNGTGATQFEAPNAVIEAVREVVEECRR